MNLTEAALYLGKSPRSLENYVKQGKITPSYIPSANSRPTVDFSETDLRKLKEELSPTLNPPVSATKISERSFAKTGNTLVSETALARVTPSSPANGFTSETPIFVQVVEPPKRSEVPLESKPLLTVEEASRLWSISEKILRDAIKMGNLPSGKIGRATRIIPEDLAAWVRNQITK